MTEGARLLMADGRGVLDPEEAEDLAGEHPEQFLRWVASTCIGDALRMGGWSCAGMIRQRLAPEVIDMTRYRWRVACAISEGHIRSRDAQHVSDSRDFGSEEVWRQARRDLEILREYLEIPGEPVLVQSATYARVQVVRSLPESWVTRTEEIDRLRVILEREPFLVVPEHLRPEYDPFQEVGHGQT